MSPYEDITSDTIHLNLENRFATEFSASLRMSKRPPLRVVGVIGGGGALAKIEKGRKIMQERKSKWSQADESPVSSTLALEVRFAHTEWSRSKFFCLVEADTIWSLHARPGVERSVDEAEPVNDDELQTCHFERKSVKAEQGE